MSQENLLDRYNCGPVKFSGADNALYERHLTFDQVIPVNEAAPRDKFEAVARSIRDVLSQRWLQDGSRLIVNATPSAFITCRSNSTWAGPGEQHHQPDARPVIGQFCKSHRSIRWRSSSRAGRRPWQWRAWPARACFLDSMATLGIPAWAPACAKNTASSSRLSVTAGTRATGSLARTARSVGRSRDQ
jgi:starch phosphorylase